MFTKLIMTVGIAVMILLMGCSLIKESTKATQLVENLALYEMGIELNKYINETDRAEINAYLTALEKIGITDVTAKLLEVGKAYLCRKVKVSNRTERILNALFVVYEIDSSLPDVPKISKSRLKVLIKEFKAGLKAGK